MSETNTRAHTVWYLVCGSFAVLILLTMFTISEQVLDKKVPISVSDEPGHWSCSILNSNSFGECLGDLAQELDITAAPALDANDACQYAQSRSTNTLWIGNTDNSTSWADALKRAEYQAQVESEGDYAEVSPARKVLESIGVTYHSNFWGTKTLEADLPELEKNDEARKALGDYISNLEMNTPVSSFYIEAPADSGILQLVNIADRTNITLGSEGFKENLIETHNLTPVQCPTSN